MSFRKILIAVDESAFSALAADEPGRSSFRDYFRRARGCSHSALQMV